MVVGGKPFSGLSRPVSSHSARYTLVPLKTRQNVQIRSRTSVPTQAFIQTKQDTVKLPIDFYALLQINPGVSRESVSRAHER
jgi:hypothetical protein